MAIGAAIIWLFANPLIALLLSIALVVYAIRRGWFMRLIAIMVVAVFTYILIGWMGLDLSGTVGVAVITMILVVVVAPLIIQKWLQDDEVQAITQTNVRAKAALLNIQSQAQQRH